MEISTKIGLVGFFLALSALNIPAANATVKATESTTIESRLSRITETLKQRENQLPQTSEAPQPGEQIARGAWGNGGGRGWVNRGGGGRWGDGRSWLDGGGWRNGNNWRNGWGDGGRFVNFR
ncbi:MAG: GrrA/OscA1 family cyclophane-containing rSAM-modified RiPP [Planktothrix sp. GU0601_MAG3]|nr:MAG: GrrA/OscA1 family cyclophane-containing rSAM-modified RiPP [Planktothrix sp. GU0601_MAG3]